MRVSLIFLLILPLPLIYSGPMNLPKCCGNEDESIFEGKCTRQRNVEPVDNSSLSYHKIRANFNFYEKIPSCPSEELVLVNSSFAKRGEGFSRNEYFKHDQIFYPADDFCIDRINYTMSLVKNVTVKMYALSVLVCSPGCNNSSGQKPCFPKCCPPGLSVAFNEKGSYCGADVKKNWIPKIWNENNSTSLGHGHLPRYWVNGIFMSGDVFFDARATKSNIPGFHEDAASIQILANGSVLLRKNLISKDFCLDGILPSEQNFSSVEFSGVPEETGIFVLLECPKEDPTRTTLYTVGFFISAMFLLLNITVYICLWKTRKSVYWLTQLSYFISFFCMVIFLGVAFIISDIYHLKGRKEIMGWPCFVTGVIAHFFFLSTFCWITMINVDLWCTFGCPERMIATSRSIKSSNPKKFRKYVWYIAFALLVPSAIVGVGLVLDFEARGQGLVTPDYGREKCFIAAKSQLPYLNGPIGLMMAANIIIFVATIIAVIKFKKESVKMSIALKKSSDTDSQSSETRKSMKLFAKLFLIMGIPWTLEIIGWAVNGTSWPWKILDVLNILQSVLIFFIFVCKRGIVRELRGKYSWLNKLLKSLHIKLGEVKMSTPSTSATSRPFLEKGNARNPKLSNQNSKSVDFSSSGTKCTSLSSENVE